MWSRSMRLELVPVADVDPDELWGLYRRHFHGGRACLDQSLAKAQVVGCFRDQRDGALRGMAMFAVRRATCGGRSIYWLWSGGVATDRACRGQWLYERAALWTILRFRLRHPLAALYAVCVSISFQSFRLVARNARTYWPHPTLQTPAFERSLLEQVHEEMADRWDATRDVCRAIPGKAVRCESSRTSTPADAPLRAHYDRLNPGAARGEGVVLVTPLDAANLTWVVWGGIRLAATRALSAIRAWLGTTVPMRATEPAVR